MITDLVDYLNNNLIIAHYCGFDITKPLPSYWSFERFLKSFDHEELSSIMKDQVLFLSKKGIIDTSFIGLDSTPVAANTSQNNPKSFLSNKFSKTKHPTCDKDCKLGVHTASNQTNEKKFEFFWGYKSHVLVDCITGLPIYELTTTAEVYDSTVALEILAKTNDFLPVQECSFLADKGYDVKQIYNQIHSLYHGSCFIPINKRGTKNKKLLPIGNPVCEAGLAMNSDGLCHTANTTRHKYCCPYKYSHDENACPCHHKNYYNRKKHRGCIRWTTVPDDIRLSINRDSKYFKSNYALRTECERYNSRFKAAGQERMWVRNKNSVTNLCTITHICMLAIAIAAINTKSEISYRKMKALKRSA